MELQNSLPHCQETINRFLNSVKMRMIYDLPKNLEECNLGVVSNIANY